MKLKNRRLRLFYVLCMILFTVDGYGQEISEILSDFNEVKTFNGVEVELIPAKDNRIDISGHSKEKVRFELIENRLEIRLSLENILSEDNTTITVYFRSLQVIDANENSVINLNQEYTCGNMVFRAQEGASVFARIDAVRVSSKAVTGGQIQLVGKAKYQDVEINTGGHFFGNKFITNNTDVKINVGGLAEIYATEYCKATARFGGNIYVYGNPDLLDRKTTLGGKIKKMN